MADAPVADERDLVASGLDLCRVDAVVLGVPDLTAAEQLFRKVYGWVPAKTIEDARFGACLAWFPGTPVILAAPLDAMSWLAVRLRRLGPSPCAYIFEVRGAAPTASEATPGTSWCGRSVAWLPAEQIGGHRLGLTSSLAILRRAGRLVFHTPSIVWNFFRSRVRAGASKKSISGPSGSARIVEAFVVPPP